MMLQDDMNILKETQDVRNGNVTETWMRIQGKELITMQGMNT